MKSSLTTSVSRSSLVASSLCCSAANHDYRLTERSASCNESNCGCFTSWLGKVLVSKQTVGAAHEPPVWDWTEVLPSLILKPHYVSYYPDTPPLPLLNVSLPLAPLLKLFFLFSLASEPKPVPFCLFFSFFQIPPSIHYPAGASGAPSQSEVVVGQMAVRVVAHKPWGGRHLLMEDKWDKTRMRNGSQTRGGRGINRNKWKRGETWKYRMYIVLLACFPWCYHARQKKATGQRAGIQNESTKCTFCMKIRTLQQAHIIPIWSIGCI